jgi:hypothetical protein
MRAASRWDPGYLPRSKPVPPDGVLFGPTRARASHERARQLRRPYQHHRITVFGKDFMAWAF